MRLWVIYWSNELDRDAGETPVVAPRFCTVARDFADLSLWKDGAIEEWHQAHGDDEVPPDVVGWTSFRDALPSGVETWAWEANTAGSLAVATIVARSVEV